MWLAGILEGEGSFGYHRGSPVIQLSMTDPDVVDRAAEVMHVHPQKMWGRKDGYKPVARAVAHGTRAIGLMMSVLPLMGQRRRARILEILSTWKASPRAPRAPKDLPPFMARCHPDRRVAGNGLCDPCYMRQWRVKRKEQT
jgi:hypothetical protein